MSKPDLTQVRLATMTYIARAMTHGDEVPGRSRGDYLVPEVARVAANERLQDHLRGVISHAAQVLEALEQSRLCHGAGAKDAFSGLPHLAHLAARVNLAIAGAAASGLIPNDPGPAHPLRSLTLDKK